MSGQGEPGNAAQPGEPKLKLDGTPDHRFKEVRFDRSLYHLLLTNFLARRR